MLPYEVLVGLRRTMCSHIYAHGLIQKKCSLLQLNVQNLSNHFCSNLWRNNSKDQLICKKINNITRFHTQFLVNSEANLSSFNKIKSNDVPESIKDSDCDLNFDLKNEFESITESTGKSVNNSIKIPKDVQTWLFTSIEKVPVKAIERLFPEPKSYLHNLYNIISNETNIAHCLTSTCKQEKRQKLAWAFTYKMKWPEEKSFTSVAHSKASASLSAALKCLYWLKINKKIKNRLPVIYDHKQKQLLLEEPDVLNVDKSKLEKVAHFLDKYEKKIVNIIAQNQNIDNESFYKYKEKKHIISNFEVNVDMRNSILKTRFEERKSISKPDLPIFQYKDQILKEIEENQGLVIKGDTGCGKTTQVPQFIMDQMVENENGSNCNIIVTQPRRISAISISQRIAFERGESIGDVIGYQVRLQQVLPKQHGAILFCTTGILLKKIEKNSKLNGCSHVIIDEAHERSVDTDMLLVLLKRAMKENPALKVIVMSATISADLFQEYLGCNVVNVPGRLYPVKMHFLEDIYQLGIPKTKKEDPSDDEKVTVDCDQIASLINYVAKNKPPGAILCFLPGWNHIQQIQKLLEDDVCSDIEKIVIPLHSKIHFSQQNEIFQTPPDGIRKIILSTDIAETGITVPDVVYVIDSACHKEVRWIESKGLSSIDTHRISRANLNQRKGRAGRVQKGESYHFLTRDQYELLDEYPLPEVLRVSLEKTVLDGKLHSTEKAVDFLGSMPQPPRISALKIAVRDLQILGALDINENLTCLGKKIAPFSIHPKLSKAIVYSSIFQCLTPVTTISSVLSMDSEIFKGTLLNKSYSRALKERFHPSSDHISIAWIYSQWSNFLERGSQDAMNFCRKNHLHADRMMTLHKIRNMNLQQLFEIRLINNVEQASNLESEENKYSLFDELIRGILLSGMDQILKHRNFDFKKGRITRTGSSMVTEDNVKAQLTPECVNYKRTKWPSSYLVYYQKTHSSERRISLIRESSILSPVTVLLFSQGRVTGTKYQDNKLNDDKINIMNEDDKILLEISEKSNVKLVCDKKTAELLLRFRDIMWLIVRYYVENGVDQKGLYQLDDLDDLNSLTMFKTEMLKVLADLLSKTSTSIDAVEENSGLLYSSESSSKY